MTPSMPILFSSPGIRPFLKITFRQELTKGIDSVTMYRLQLPWLRARRSPYL